MPSFLGLLPHHELLLLFTVILLGLLLGRLQYRGMRLGLAGVLFAGLGLSAWLSPELKLKLAPEIKELGLVLFVYMVGLTSGPGFFSAWRDRGVKLSGAVVLALLLGAAIAVVGGKMLGLDRGHMAGVFCGALTNTPALAAAGERLGGTPFALHPALAYSVTYPFGVLGALLLFRGFARVRHTLLAREISAKAGSEAVALHSRNYEVTNPALVDKSIGELEIRDKIGVLVSRLKRGPDVKVVTKYTVLQAGDVLTAVGPDSALDAALTYFGAASNEPIALNRERVDYRRVLLSRRELVGKSLGELELDRRFNAQVTRLRRADLDLLPSPEVRLALGDRLRIVAPSNRLPEIGKYFGDSERALAEIDYVALALGLCAGLLLAKVPFSMFGSSLQLGIAGGPLVVALLLGRLGRTGSLTWSLPYEANTTLRELGLLLFLAGVGVSAGGQLGPAIAAHGVALAGLGAMVTLVTTGVLLTALAIWGQAGVVTSLGVASGMQTQPATLAAAHEISSKSEEVYVAYALVYPVAMIGKILLAQLIALFG